MVQSQALGSGARKKVGAYLNSWGQNKMRGKI